MIITNLNNSKRNHKRKGNMDFCFWSVLVLMVSWGLVHQSGASIEAMKVNKHKKRITIQYLYLIVPLHLFFFFTFLHRSCFIPKHTLKMKIVHPNYVTVLLNLVY